MGGYPNRYQPMTDFALEQQQGHAVSGTDLAMELANAAASINELIGFVRAGFTSNRRWQPTSAKAQDLVEQYTYTASSGQTTFLFPTGTTADPLTDKARVFSSGVLIPPGSVTLTATGVVTPAQNASTVIVVELFNDAQSLRTDLAATTTNLGAALVGIEDVLGYFVSHNAEDAFAEVGAQLEAIKGQVIDQLSLLANGSQEWLEDQNANSNRLTNLSDGDKPSDAATVGQLQALGAIYGDLSVIFLPRNGGVMSGPVNMGNFHITEVADPSQPGDAINKRTLDAHSAAADAKYVDAAGDSMTGNLSMGGKQVRGLSNEVVTEGDQSRALRADQIQSLIGGVSVAGSYIGGLGDDYNTVGVDCPPCADSDFPDMTIEDSVHDFRGDVAWPGDQLSLAHMTTIRVAGNLDLRNLQIVVANAQTTMNEGDYAASPTESSVFGYPATTIDNSAQRVHGPIRPRNFTSEMCGGSAGNNSPDSGNDGHCGAGGAGGRGGLGKKFGDDELDWCGQGCASWMAWPQGMWKGSTIPRGGDGWTVKRTFFPGKGGIRIMVDGNIDLTGAEINADSNVARDLDIDEMTAATCGAGSIVIICKGTVTCGAGAVLSAKGRIAEDDYYGGDSGGSGGGYIAVIANRITGTLNITCKGGQAWHESYEGQGGFVEVSRAVVDDADVDPIIDVSQGDPDWKTARAEATWVGRSRITSHVADRLPFYSPG